jgi:hypothetical protein
MVEHTITFMTSTHWLPQESRGKQDDIGFETVYFPIISLKSTNVFKAIQNIIRWNSIGEHDEFNIIWA